MHQLNEDINKSLEKLSTYVLLFTLLISFIAIIFDLLFITQQIEIVYGNIFTLLVIAILMTIYLYKKSFTRIIFAILIYSLLLNILFTNTISQIGTNINGFFMRDTISVLILLLLSGIVIKRIHCLIIGGIYTLFYISIVVIFKSAFLIQSMPAILSIVLGYSICLYILINILEGGISKQDKLNKQVLCQNNELCFQTKNLNEINSLLSKQTIEVRNQQKELQRLNSTKDKFFSLLAHDLKAPMSSIIGFSDLLITNWEDYDKEKTKKYVGYISKASNNVFNLLENLLEWSSSQSDTIKFAPKKLSVKDIFISIEDLFDPLAKNKEITLTIDYGENLYIHADKHMLITVLRNLISNAIKYSKTKGVVSLNAQKMAEKITISITDHGLGMNQKQMDSLFLIEKTNSTVGTMGEKGTGLGLIICNDFLKKHQSLLNVISEKEKGTTFSFDIKRIKS